MTIECFVMLCTGWKLDSGGILHNSTGLFVVSAVQSVVCEMFQTSKSSTSIVVSVKKQYWWLADL